VPSAFSTRATTSVRSRITRSVTIMARSMPSLLHSSARLADGAVAEHDARRLIDAELRSRRSPWAILVEDVVGTAVAHSTSSLERDVI